jgi:hypothetical protein
MISVDIHSLSRQGAINMQSNPASNVAASNVSTGMHSDPSGPVPTLDQLKELNLVENVYALFRLQQYVEGHKALAHLINIMDRILPKPVHLTSQLAQELMELCISKRSYHLAIEIYLKRPADVTLAGYAVMNALNQFCMRDSFIAEGISLLCSELQKGNVEANGDLIRKYIEKCLEFNKYDALQELGLALVEKMKVGGNGGTTDFGIHGFGDDDFYHIIAVCVAHQQYEAAGQVALAAFRKGWLKVSETFIRDQIFDPYYVQSIQSLSGKDDYNPMHEGCLHPYGKMLKLVGAAMEVMPSINHTYVFERLFQLIEIFVIVFRGSGLYMSEKDKPGFNVAESYRYLIYIPLVKYRSAELKLEEFERWLDFQIRNGLWSQAGSLAAEGLHAGLVDQQQFERWMGRLVDYGCIPLLCAAINERKEYITADVIKKYVDKCAGSIIWFSAEAILAGMEAGMAFELGDLKRWIDKLCIPLDKASKTAGVRIVKAALTHGLPLSAEFITGCASKCIKDKVPWLAVDLALAARAAGIDLDHEQVEQWREASFHAEASDLTVESMIHLIEVYRARPEYVLTAGMEEQANQAFENVMQQRETVGLTETIPAVEAEAKIRDILFTSAKSLNG